MKSLFTSAPLSATGVAAIRILFGILTTYHGLQIFNSKEMAEYGPWFTEMHIPMPMLMAYLGKALELLGGICLIIGLYTRAASLLLVATFLFITFVIGNGKIFTDSQHPFLFAVLSALFFFSGSGAWSVQRK